MTQWRPEPGPRDAWATAGIRVALWGCGTLVRMNARVSPAQMLVGGLLLAVLLVLGAVLVTGVLLVAAVGVGLAALNLLYLPRVARWLRVSESVLALVLLPLLIAPGSCWAGSAGRGAPRSGLSGIGVPRRFAARARHTLFSRPRGELYRDSAREPGATDADRVAHGSALATRRRPRSRRHRRLTVGRSARGATCWAVTSSTVERVEGGDRCRSADPADAVHTARGDGDIEIQPRVIGGLLSTVISGPGTAMATRERSRLRRHRRLTPVSSGSPGH